MNADIQVSKLNESYIKIKCEPAIAAELSDDFTFYTPDYQFHPLVKANKWDGKIRLFDKRSYTILSGLVWRLAEWAKDKGYSTHVDYPLRHDVTIQSVIDRVSLLNLPFEPRQDQLEILQESWSTNRGTIVSPTGSGKSLLVYLLTQAVLPRHVLIVCPTTGLVEQMFNDFKDYGFDAENECLKVWEGVPINLDKRVIISTWQSMVAECDKPSYYRNPGISQEKGGILPYFGQVIVDEAHGAPAKSISKIVQGCTGASWRYGLTGTLNDPEMHQLQLEGLFGPPIYGETTKELMESDVLARLKIINIVLEYPENERKFMVGQKYPYESDWLATHSSRNRYILNLTQSIKGSSFVLCRLIDKQAKGMFKELKERIGNDAKLVYGDTKVEDRETIRKLANVDDNVSVVASYGVFSGGVNVPNLKNVIFASPYKSKIKVLQSIGRALRRTDTKTEATVYDIVDNLSIGNYQNYSMQHFLQRIQIYNKELFEYRTIRVPIKARE
jgi:superfamily II DNA or RNA helicase